MTVSRGLGFGPATPFKQQALNHILPHLFSADAAVAKKYGNPYVIADLTAGPGADPKGRDGSPLIIANVIMQQFLNRGFKPDLLIFAERRKAFRNELRPRITERFAHMAALHVPVEYFPEQWSAIALIPRDAVGLAYFDPNGYSAPGEGLDAELLSQFGRSHPRMDILITREVGAYLRMKPAAHCLDTKSTEEYLALASKRCIYTMQYAAHQKWTFGFGDNYVKRPPWKMRGWHILRHPEAPIEHAWQQEELPWPA